MYPYSPSLMMCFTLAMLIQFADLCSTRDRPRCYDYRKSVLDLNGKCGLTRRRMWAYIMNGRDVEIGEFPWMAHLLYRGTEEGDMDILPQCSGSVIHGRWILTAAHCCLDTLEYVRLGEFDIRFNIDCQNWHCAPTHVDMKVDYYVNHKEYDDVTLDNDICLVRLKEEIQFTDYIQPICLPIYCVLQTTDFKRARFIVAGWGEIGDEDHTEATILQKATVPIVSNSECNWWWGNITDAHICAGMHDGKDACLGDSGGPLMYKAAVYGPTRFFQVGVVSSGNECNITDPEQVPGVYARVAYYLPWLKQTIEQNV